ncbi:MAG: AAA family ATPase [Gemmatimonadota bacterium]
MLRAIRFQPPPATSDTPADAESGYPFAIPALQGLDEIRLDGPMVFLVGENGSGKSTLLEALAVATGLPTVGSRAAGDDPTLLRAEDVFGFILSLRRQRRQLEAELESTRRRMEGASEYALGLALGPHRASLAAMQARYGDDPDARSHGETFLHLFRERIVPGGLYLLDEPEAALSPTSQMALVTLLDEAVASGSQFVIATHSPLLLAIPDAIRLSFDREPLSIVAWDELESVRLWRDVLQTPDRFLRHLWSGGNG